MENINCAAVRKHGPFDGQFASVSPSNKSVFARIIRMYPPGVREHGLKHGDKRKQCPRTIRFFKEKRRYLWTSVNNGC